MQTDTGEPLYPYLHLCALGLRDLDFDRIIDTVAFLKTYDRTIRTISDYERKHGRNSYSITLLGFAYASHSSFYLIHKKYFSAIGTGLDAVRMCDEGKKLDTSNCDVDFFLGFYNYAKGELRKKLWMVLFWYPGSKREGIRTLERCRDRGQLVSEGAKMVLADVYSREAQFKKSRDLLDCLYRKYSQSRFLFWSEARYFEDLKEPLNSARVYGKLADSYAQERFGAYNACVTRLKQVELLAAAGRKDEAAQIAERFSAGPLCDKLEETKKICRDIRKYCRE
jgi:hypothetical protein